MARCLIGLGSNLGNRAQMLDQAVARLARQPQMRLAAHSAWRETRPIGGPPGQPPFLNGAALLETSLQPPAVLDVLQQIEIDLGRRPAERWSPRPIDLDLLLYDEVVLRATRLALPHPRMAWRRFVLLPAAEVAGSMRHPTVGWTVARLLDHLDNAAPYVALTGPIAAGKTQLAQRLQDQTAAQLIAEQLDLKRLAAFHAHWAGHAWQMQLQFLYQRAGLLAADSTPWSTDRRLTISDFWFDQSLAYARVWLPPGRLRAFQRRFDQLRPGVVQPKLRVLLDVPAKQLLPRVVRRGRAGERRLGRQQLERIRRSVAAQASRPDQGPLLRLTADDSEQALAELLAAVQAME